MSAEEVDLYLAELDEPKRSTLTRLRRSILSVVPEAEEGISYGVPAFRLSGRNVAGFSVAAKHLSYLTHSGDVVAALDPEDLEGFSTSKGTVRMPVDTALPDALVRKLIEARRSELDA